MRKPEAEAENDDAARDPEDQARARAGEVALKPTSLLFRDSDADAGRASRCQEAVEDSRERNPLIVVSLASSYFPVHTPSPLSQHSGD